MVINISSLWIITDDQGSKWCSITILSTIILILLKIHRICSPLTFERRAQISGRDKYELTEGGKKSTRTIIVHVHSNNFIKPYTKYYLIAVLKNRFTKCSLLVSVVFCTINY